jgi:hypothetical protein
MSTDTSDTYDDGYEYDDSAEFHVKVIYKKVGLKPNGIFALAIECYSCAYEKAESHSIHYFRVESDAMEFVKILELHAKKSIYPK